MLKFLNNFDELKIEFQFATSSNKVLLAINFFVAQGGSINNCNNKVDI